MGARQAESNDVIRWEILAPFLKNLQKLIVVLIGPELGWPYPVADFTYVTPALSEQRPDLSIRYSFVKQTYHSYVNKRKQFIKPDAVAALNCGFIFYQSWDASIPAMLK